MRLLVGKALNALRFWIADSAVDEWFDQRDLFFVSGMGRSGTKFLARLLDADASAVVFHEPLAEDFEAIVAAKDNDQAALRYIEDFRKKRMYCLVRKRDVTTYGEVNSALRYHLRALADVFPSARFVHLTRDGREVVRSLMARRHHTSGGEGHHNLSPAASDRLDHRWSTFSRFEKICWLWADAVDRVEECTGHRVQLERLVDSYEYFYQRIEKFLGVHVGREVWHREVNRPRNRTSGHVIPHWKQWGDERREQFEAICSAQMQKTGYW